MATLVGPSGISDFSYRIDLPRAGYASEELIVGANGLLRRFMATGSDGTRYVVRFVGWPQEAQDLLAQAAASPQEPVTNSPGTVTAASAVDWYPCWGWQTIWQDWKGDGSSFFLPSPGCDHYGFGATMSKSSAGEVYVRARGETNLDWWEETGQGWKFLYFEGETNGWARFTGWDAPPIGDCWGDLVYVMEANAWRDVGNGNWVAVGSTRLPLVEFRGADEGEKFYSQANKDMVIPFYAQPGYYHYWEMRANVEAKAQCRGIGALLNAEFNSETGIGDFEHLVPRVWLSDQVLP